MSRWRNIVNGVPEDFARETFRKSGKVPAKIGSGLGCDEEPIRVLDESLHDLLSLSFYVRSSSSFLPVAMPNTHLLHVQNIWCDKIASGQKRWEGRLNNAGVADINVGDVIEFESEDREPLKAAVVSILRFPDFEKMLEGEGLQRLLPGIRSVDEGLEIYRSFPGYREGEREFGAVIFELGKLL